MKGVNLVTPLSNLKLESLYHPLSVTEDYRLLGLVDEDEPVKNFCLHISVEFKIKLLNLLSSELLLLNNYLSRIHLIKPRKFFYVIVKSC